VTAEESNELFRKMINACARLMVDPGVVVHCHAYRDRDSTARRVRVVRELLKNGFTPGQIRLVCPMTPYGLRKLLAGKKTSPSKI
jgi:hypothetical protein